MKDDAPIRRDSTTAAEMVVTGEPDFEASRARLVELIEAFVAGGPERCTDWPHMFFGRLTGEEWGVLVYKHLDHHLRQFGV
jgi:Protein of unknown function (DUF1569)